MDFTKWLQNELKERDISQHELAVAADIQQPQISRYFNGIHSPNLATMNKILKVLGKRLVIVDDV